MTMTLPRVQSLLLMFTVISALQCAEPTEPESLYPGGGGYTVVGRLAMPGYAQDVAVQDTFAYVAQGEGGLLVVSIADPAQPGVLASLNEGIRGYAYRLALKDSVVFIAAGDFGVSVANVADPRAPYATASNLAMRPARGFQVFGDYLFTAVSEGGVKIAEISYPTQPDIRGGVATFGYARAAASTPDSTRLLVACGEMGLTIHDITDMRDGFGEYPVAGWTDTPGYAEDVVPLGDRPYALMACGAAGAVVVDFSDTAHLRITGTVATDGTARRVAYRNNRMYVAADRSGLFIIDVGNPNAPVAVGHIETPAAYGVAVNNTHVFVADRQDGLIVIRIP